MSNGTLMMIQGMREQLGGELCNRGLISSVKGASSQAHSPAIVRCVLVRIVHPVSEDSSTAGPVIIVFRKY